MAQLYKLSGETTQLQINDSYLEKFLNLLQALPQNKTKG